MLPVAANLPCPTVQTPPDPLIPGAGLKEAEGFFPADAPCRHLHNVLFL